MASFLQFCSETTPLPLAGPLTSFEQCFTLILELKRVQVMENVFDLLSGLTNKWGHNIYIFRGSGFLNIDYIIYYTLSNKINK